MSPAEPSHARRNRIIAIAAGTITVVAIVLVFASGYLGQQWLWLRPAGELLLLAELVGLIVLERHQLFEPVSEKVATMETGIEELRSMLARMDQKMDPAGQLTVTVGVRETARLRARLFMDAVSRDHDGPEVMRNASLSGIVLGQDPRELGDDDMATIRKANFGDRTDP